MPNNERSGDLEDVSAMAESRFAYYNLPGPELPGINKIIRNTDFCCAQHCCAQQKSGSFEFLE
jgi:hypothetical protein